MEKAWIKRKRVSRCFIFAIKGVLCVGPLLTVGCTTTATTDQIKDQPRSDTEAFANRMIADKVSQAANAQHDYVALVQENNEITARKQLSMDTDKIDIDYIGKPQELLQTFAYRYGYRYIESGKRCDLRTINLRMLKVAPVEVLKNVGIQVDNSADVVLDKSTRTIRLIYKNIVDKKG